MHEQPTLNFVVLGQERCGASVIQTSVCDHPRAVCHPELLHASQRVRQENHEAYFGLSSPEMPRWCHKLMSPEHYLSLQVFDHPERGEQAVGVKILYPQVQTCDLWEYLRQMTLRGDFCVIHVLRNPLACYVSKKQAKDTGNWVQFAGDPSEVEIPPPVCISDIAEVTDFCRAHQSFAERVAHWCDDRLEINYQELFLDYHRVMAEVFSFLGLPACPGVRCGTRRLKNRNIRERILNFEEARARVPYDVRVHFEAADLF